MNAKSFFPRILPTLVAIAFAFYHAWMLLVPSLPVADTMELPVAVSRAQYWLLQVTTPNSFAWHWTGGFRPVEVLDRIPIAMFAILWIAMCGLNGWSIIAFDSVTKRMGIWQKLCLAILVGQVVLSACCFLIGTVLGTKWVAPSLMVGVVLHGVGWLVYCRYNNQSRQECLPGNRFPIEPDLSFSNTIYRRLVGLLVLGIIWLAAVQAYGAAIPTVDHEVRTTDWWIAKHAIQDGSLRFHSENIDSNAPNAFAMPAIFFSSLASHLSIDTPAKDRIGIATVGSATIKRQYGAVFAGVAAAKVVHALICLVGIAFLGLFIRDKYGVLPSCAVSFLLLSTPGIAELTRFGRTEALVGVFASTLVVLWSLNTTTSNFGSVRSIIQSRPSWWLMSAGALSVGYGTAILVGVPAILISMGDCFRLRLRGGAKEPVQSNTKRSPGTFSVFLLIIATFSIATLPYLRNLLDAGDPIYPWMSRMAMRPERSDGFDNDLRLWGLKYQVPSATVEEQIERLVEEQETAITSNVPAQKSAYRLANILDCIRRVVWDSNAHGLLLIPFIVLGVFVTRMGMRNGRKGSTIASVESTRRVESEIALSLVWVGSWMVVWWCFSRRLDRDWVGGLFLFAFAAAAGIHWLMKRTSPTWLGLLLLIPLVWSVVVIPVWPTCDNRILMSLNELDPTQSLSADAWTETAAQRSNAPDSREEAPKNIIAHFNSLIKEGTVLSESSVILLVGSQDDFGLSCQSITQSPYASGPWSLGSSSSSHEQLDLLRGKWITHVLLMWSDIAGFDKEFGCQQEEKFRSSVARMMEAGFIEPIDSQIEASRVQLFRVPEVR